MKKLLFIIALSFTVNTVMSQDIIKTMYGKDINAKVTKITKEEIKYTKADEPDAQFSIRIVKVDRIIYEDGTVKIFGGELDFEEEREAEVLFGRKEKEKKPVVVEKTLKEEDIVEVEKPTKTVKQVNYSTEIPTAVHDLAFRGAKVFLQSNNRNAAIHLRNYINKWGFWQVTPDLKNADFVVRLDVRFGGPMDYFMKANFIDAETNTNLYTSKEYRAQRGNGDPNKKRAAAKHVVDKVFIKNFK